MNTIDTTKKSLETTRQIAKILASNNLFDSEKDLSLFSGQTGIALSLFYYGKFSQDEQFYNIGFEKLQMVLDQLGEQEITSSFCNGLAGIGWTIQHLCENEFLEFDADEILMDFDEILVESSKKIISGKSPNIDFLHGLSGIVYYLLYRKQQNSFLESFLDLLDKTAVRDEDGSLRWVYTNSYLNTSSFDLGLAHGLASTISLLCKFAKVKKFASKSKEMLLGAVRYILKNKFEDSDSYSCFPNSITLENNKSTKLKSSRLAWCYGDLGIGYSLLEASEILNDKFIKEEAIDVLKKSSLRKNNSSTKIADAGFCHGSCGVAHIYQKTYALTGETIFSEASDYWIKQTIEFLNGKKITEDSKEINYYNKFDLIEGMPGILLTFIFYNNSNNVNFSKWDQIFLL